MVQEKPFDLDNFYRTRQELAGELGSTYAQRQLSEIRRLVQEDNLQKLKEDSSKANKQKSEKSDGGKK